MQIDVITVLRGSSKIAKFFNLTKLLKNNSSYVATLTWEHARMSHGVMTDSFPHKGTWFSNYIA